MAKQAPEVPVRFYRTEAGREPVLEWLRGLDKNEPSGDRVGSHAGAVRMANRHAPRAEPERPPVGGALHAPEPADRAPDPVLSRANACGAARLYQENTEDADG